MKTMPIGRMLLAISLFTMLGAGAGMAQDQPKLSEKQATEIGVDAYIYGYPLLVMDSVRRVSTNVTVPHDKLAPMGQFANVRSLTHRSGTLQAPM
jgi:hypothetical protein